MKFGQQLRTSLIKDYQYHYIRYDDLKLALKKPLITDPTPENPRPKRQWSEKDEKSFIEQLEGELDRVFTFQRTKYKEIVKRIDNSEEEVKDVLKRLESYDETENKDNLAEDFELLEQDLSDIIADVHDLAKYTQLNYTGFQKIVKKHDKQTPNPLKPAFQVRLTLKPFYADSYDTLVVRISKLYDVVRTRGHPVKGDSSAGGTQQNFIRQTTKYWVHKDNIAELKLIILKHLPVLVYNANKEFESKDAAVSSIYFDNTDTWELYDGRLRKTENAEAIRIRWYGPTDAKNVFVERKTHKEDWTGQKSVKARWSMKEKYVNAFLEGKMTVEQIFEKERAEGKGKKSEEEIAEHEQLAREIQYSVITRNYVPVTRSFYNRMAFQLPADARVRISLDTELTMIREDNLDGRDRAGKNWRRMDIGIDWPFSRLPPEDIVRFPYAVLEVKLQTQEGQESPEWILDLIRSHLVEAVPKFSKFIHGTALLQPSRISLLPYWMPQMDTDIRKPAIDNVGIKRLHHLDSHTTSDGDLDDNTDDEEEEDNDEDHDESDPLLGSEQHERLRHLPEFLDAMVANGRDRGVDFPQHHGNELDDEERVAATQIANEHSDHILYDSDDDDDDFEEAKRVGGWYYYRKLITHHVNLTGEYVFRGLNAMTRHAEEEQHVQEKRFKAPPGKKIHVPVRIEPKVYFAAERTFLAWLEFSIILGSIAAALMNFSFVPNPIIPDTRPRTSLNLAFASSLAFTILACLALLYSLGIYMYRSKAIRERRVIKYHEKWGPTALCVGVLMAVAVSFVVRVVVGNGDGGGLRGFVTNARIPERNGSLRSC
ncbi:MAG: vacuolar transporter chaperone [Icmadophila ericetorum]|nr:vacuolar transporter chaperone [Icmadophila ericetorum]